MPDYAMDKLRQKLITYQENEISEYHIYSRLADSMRSEENAQVLREIAEEELAHYEIWKKYTEKDVKPSKWRILKYYWISRILGFTFGIRLMERGEKDAQTNYGYLKDDIDEIDRIIHDEHEHENSLINLLDEERLRYTGSIVLGLNDALVELTGALAGLTLALRDTKLIALTGSITGIAAALSMAASEYLSTSSEDTDLSPSKASLYTGIAYIFTVIFLILPYLLFENYYLCLGVTLICAILIIALFNYYISVAKELPFYRRFFEMAGISLGIAAISFFLGLAIRAFLGVEI